MRNIEGGNNQDGGKLLSADTLTEAFVTETLGKFSWSRKHFELCPCQPLVGSQHRRIISQRTNTHLDATNASYLLVYRNVQTHADVA